MPFPPPSRRFRVLLAFDKFKGSLTAPEACAAAAEGLHASQPDWEIDVCPLADGGDGFASILTLAAGGRIERRQVTGPRGDPVEAAFGLVPLAKIPSAARERLALGSGFPPDSTIALVELAAASGLALLPPDQQDPWQTSTFGTGELVRAAAEAGAAAIVLGAGGSATHDLGLGALAALGLDLRDNHGERVLPPVPFRWKDITQLGAGSRSLGLSNRSAQSPSNCTTLSLSNGPTLSLSNGPALSLSNGPTLSLSKGLPPIRIACDVTNPLLGPRGAAAVFALQKGLRAGDAKRLEHETARMALMLCARCGQPDTLMDQPGAGAAGGFAFGLMAALGAVNVPGFELVAEWLQLEGKLAAADLVLTGEGAFDASSLGGKGPGAIVTRALALGKPVHVFAGRIDAASPAPGCKCHGIAPAGANLEQAMEHAARNLSASVRRIFSGENPI